MDNQLELQRIKVMAKELSIIADKLLGNYQTPIVELGLSTRARNALLEGGVEYIEQLIKMEMEQLLRLRNMGKVSIKEIKEKVKAFGFDCWQ